MLMLAKLLTIIKFLHSIMFYINVKEIHISKGCSIEFLSARTILIFLGVEMADYK